MIPQGEFQPAGASSSLARAYMSYSIEYVVTGYPNKIGRRGGRTQTAAMEWLRLKSKRVYWIRLVLSLVFGV
jgi:hypothetical protein